MIIYLVGSSYERSGVSAFGHELAREFPEQVLLVLLDSSSLVGEKETILEIPLVISHCPTCVVRKVIDHRSNWPAVVSILPNNAACGYEIAKMLQDYFWKIGVDSEIVGIVHSNAKASLDLVRNNCFLITKLYAVSSEILNSLEIGKSGNLTCKVLMCAVKMPQVSVADRAVTQVPQRLKLLYVGRLVEDQKRVSRLAQLVGILRTRMIPFSLQIIGDGHLAEELARVAATNPSGEVDLIMSGEQSHERVLEAMSTSDVLVLTSEFEGSPLVVMEAMSVGAVPVVMNYGPEVAELITHGVNGYVAEQGRVDVMADMLGLLASDRKKLKELSDKALLRASEFMSFNAWRDEICRPTPKRLIRNDHRNSSYVEIWERIKRGVKKIKADNKALIWGGGHIGRLTIDELISNNHEIKGCVVIDRVLYKYLPRYRDVPYYSSENFPEEKFDVAIVASEYYAAEIQATLEDWKRDHNPTLHITAVRDWR